jgi:hypothetical protein
MKIVLAALMLLMFSAALAEAHSGGTDRNGCHYDHKRGGRHCH